MLAIQIICDRAVVIRSFDESFDRETLAQFQGGFAIVLAHVFQNGVVIGRINHDRDRLVVFGRAPNHGRPADVDVLDRFSEGHIRSFDRLLERIKTHHHQVDRLEAAFPRFGFVFSVAAFVKQAAVDARMQSFDPAFQDLGKSGETGDVADRNFLLSQQIRRSAGGNDVDPLLLERAREFGDPAFVGDGNERAGDLHR